MHVSNGSDLAGFLRADQRVRGGVISLKRSREERDPPAADASFPGLETRASFLHAIYASAVERGFRRCTGPLTFFPPRLLSRLMPKFFCRLRWR